MYKFSGELCKEKTGSILRNLERLDIVVSHKCRIEILALGGINVNALPSFL